MIRESPPHIEHRSDRITDASDDEQNVGLLSGHAGSAPQSSWRNLASLSFSAFSDDTIWHQALADRTR